MQHCTAARAEKADFNVWYILMGCFPFFLLFSLQFQRKMCLIAWYKRFHNLSTFLCVGVCEGKYASLCARCQLSFVPRSTQCKDQHWTIPQCCIDKGQWKPNAAKMDIMQVPGGLSADLYVDRCTSLLCRSVVWSHSQGYSVVANGTIAQDGLWPAGEVCAW